MFASFDANGDGVLSRTEFGMAMRSLSRRSLAEGSASSRSSAAGIPDQSAGRVVDRYGRNVGVKVGGLLRAADVEWIEGGLTEGGGHANAPV